MSSFRRFAAKHGLEQELYSSAPLAKKSNWDELHRSESLGNAEYFAWCDQVEQVLKAGWGIDVTIPDEAMDDSEALYAEGSEPADAAQAIVDNWSQAAQESKLQGGGFTGQPL